MSLACKQSNPLDSLFYIVLYSYNLFLCLFIYEYERNYANKTEKLEENPINKLCAHQCRVE